MSATDTFAQRRREMVEYHLAARDIHDPAVLEAMGLVRRELFVPEDLRSGAYSDHPLPIGDGQTISQPYIVALMAQALRLGPTSAAHTPNARPTKVLEIGTGSGYGAAVLSHLAFHVVTIERLPSLVELATRQLETAGYTSVEVIAGDGTTGWPAGAPYDGIVVTAGGPSVPPSLIEQLADGGRLVIPVGDANRGQILVRVTRHGGRTQREELAGVRFVPLIGDEGW